MGHPGCRKKHFFCAKTGGKSTWRTLTPYFLQRLPGSGFFREGILRGNRQADWIFAIGKTAVVRRPLFASQMSQAGCNNDNNFHAFSNKDSFLTSNHLSTLGRFLLVDIHMANTDSLFFRVLPLYLYFFVFLCFFVFFCSWLPGPWFFRWS